MNCPVCSAVMVDKDFGVKAKVSVCESGCRGIWFDYLALRALDEKNKGAGEALQSALEYPRVNASGRAPLPCPKCGGVMHAHTYERAKEVNVDECYVCGGFFLDSGELAEVRDRYMSDEEQEAYVHRLIEEIPDCHKANIVKNEEARAAAARNFAGLIKKNYWS